MDTSILSHNIPSPNSSAADSTADDHATPAQAAGAIAEHLAKAVGPQRYAMWFARSAHFDYQPDPPTLTIVTPNRFVADWIGRHFTDSLHAAAQAHLGRSVVLELTCDSARFDQDADARSAPGSVPATASAQGPTGANPAPDQNPAPPARRDPAAAHPATELAFNSAPMRHRLDQFITGWSNELAFAAASRIADPRQDAAHPVFLHGSCGLGKTHLLQGACRAMLQADPTAKVVYTTGEHFTNQYIHAVRHNRLDGFRKRVRRLDLLAVDDIHFIANKRATQQEFLHSFDEIDLCGSRVILASDSHPKLIEQFSEALVSRCVRGLVVEVRAPDAPMRQTLIQALAKRRGLVLQEAAAATLAQRVTGSIREIEGTLTKLQALLSLTANHPAQGPTHAIGHAVIDRLFAHTDGLSKGPRKPLRFDAILNVVCERLGVEPQQVLGPARHRHVVLARSLTVHLARELTSMSYPEIAKAMGRKNHSTVITAAQRLGRQLQANAPLTLPTQHDPIAPADLVAQLRHHLEHGVG